MKKRKIGKLRLHRETVRSLTSREMQGVHGHAQVTVNCNVTEPYQLTDSCDPGLCWFTVNLCPC